MAKILIIVGQGPYTHERPYTAFRFALTALMEDHEVKMFMFEDAVFAVLKNQQPANVYNVGEWVQKCLDEDNFEIAACGVCTKARGISANSLMDGVKTGTMEMAVQYTVWSDKQLFF